MKNSPAMKAQRRCRPACSIPKAGRLIRDENLLNLARVLAASVFRAVDSE
jgi:hypothetical protein